MQIQRMYKMRLTGSKNSRQSNGTNNNLLSTEMGQYTIAISLLRVVFRLKITINKTHNTVYVYDKSEWNFKEKNLP